LEDAPQAVKIQKIQKRVRLDPPSLLKLQSLAPSLWRLAGRHRLFILSDFLLDWNLTGKCPTPVWKATFMAELKRKPYTQQQLP
jgi:hypothetical protein